MLLGWSGTPMSLAALVALGTFLAVTMYVANVNSQVGSRVTVYQASESIDAYEPLGPSKLKAVEVPAKWTSESSVLTMNELLGRRVGFPLSPGTTLNADMLIPNSSLSSTEREVAINVDPVTGVAGRVRPGDRVDVYAIFGKVPGLPKSAKVLVRDVRIVSIAGQQRVTKASTEGLSEETVVPITLALEQSDSLKVAYANAFADEVRLVALPNDVGTERKDEINQFDAEDLGGKAVIEGEE